MPVRTPGTPSARWLAHLALALGLMLLGGCALPSRAHPGRLDSAAGLLPLPEEAWPARDAARLARAVQRTPSEIYLLAFDGSRAPDQIPAVFLPLVTQPRARVTHAGVYGKGIIRELDFGAQTDPRASADLRFVSYSVAADRPFSSAAWGWSSTYRRLARGLRGADLGLRLADLRQLMVAHEGVAMRLYEPDRLPTRGLAIHLCGWNSYAFERPLTEELLGRGWAVLDVETATMTGFRGPPLRVSCEDDLEGVARRVARIVDDRLAETAYAVEAAILYLARTRPDLPQRPLVLVGCSAGALATPAAAARLLGSVDAAVLVCGGANLLNISQRSEFTNAGIDIRWENGNRWSSCRRRLEREYLRQTRLDPYQAARYLRGVPVLAVHALFDQIIPADTGRLLHQRLGQPDRLDYPLGHRTMFWKFELRTGEIADWLERTCARLPRGRSPRTVAATVPFMPERPPDVSVPARSPAPPTPAPARSGL